MCVSQSIDFFLTSTVLKTEYIMIYAAQPEIYWFIWIELAAVFTAFI